MRSTFLTALLIAAVNFSAGAAETAKPMDPKKAEMMKAWQEYATPSDAHKVLAGTVGNWKYTSKFWEAADATPEESKGTSKLKMILGGRFLQHETKGKAMGMPFEGLGITGYDNIKKKYDTLWMDTMGTGVMHGSGSFDAATSTLTDKGEFTCPLTKGKTREYRTEWKITDKKNMTFTMYGPGPEGGKEFKQMEMIFKR